MSTPSATTTRYLHKFHRWAGLFLAAFVLFYSVTGVLLNHRKAFSYFIEKRSTFQNVTPAAITPVTNFIEYYKQQIERSDDPKIIRIRPEGTIEFLYGSHGRTTYIINPLTGRMETVTKHSSEPLSFLNKLHKSFGTNTFWIVFTDILSVLLIFITITSLVVLRYKAIDFIFIACGIILCFAGGYFA